MLKLLELSFAFIISSQLLAQINSYHTPENIKLFADYLFCQKDYIRAIEEFNKLDSENFNDTVNLKLGYSFFQLKNYEKANYFFDRVTNNSSLKTLSLSYKALQFFFTKEIDSIRILYSKNSDLNIEGVWKLYNVGRVLFNSQNITEDEINKFSHSERVFIQKLIQDKFNPDHKSPFFAASLSIIPGLGKFYTGEYTDAVTSLLLTTLFSYIAYDNFSNSHKFRGYFFAGISLGFYLGNIFGSFYSAKKYNSDFDKKVFNDSMEYLHNVNFFIEDVKICK
jgi:tetratricopeptide (TPR) repeat protein